MPHSNLDKLQQLTTGRLVDLEIVTPTSSKRVKTEFIGLLEITQVQSVYLLQVITYVTV